MAYASKELKSKVNDLVKKIAKDMDIKLGFTLKIEDHSRIVLNIRSCSINLEKEFLDKVESVYNYHVENNLCDLRRYDRIASLRNAYMNMGDIRFNKDNPSEVFEGKALELMEKLLEAIKCDYYDNSDVMRDYFETAYYYDIRIGDTASGFKAV